jgi:heme-degrading monooxygenase HmoA
MIIVHDIFICKPGNASKLAKKFKEGMRGMNELVHVMTDMVGQFNKVVIVSQYESLTAYEQSFEKYMQHSDEMKKMQEAMEGYHDMYYKGSREIYQVTK